jgi:hypothetical protein
VLSCVALNMISLKYVKIINVNERIKSILDYKCFSINYLQSNIEGLQLSATSDIEIDTLPINLKYLKISSLLFNKNIDYLPLYLNTLIIQSSYF